MNNLQNLRKVATVSMVLLLPFLASACSGLQVSAKCEAGQQDGKEHWSCEVTASKEFWIWDGSGGSPYVIEGFADELRATYGFLLDSDIVDLTVYTEPH